jgi:hypothetical protein
MAKGDRCLRRKQREAREMRKNRNFAEVIRSVWPWKTGTGERCARKPARTVRGGADRKVSVKR